MKFAKMALFTGLVMASLMGGTAQAQVDEFSPNYSEVERDYHTAEQEPAGQFVSKSNEPDEEQESSAVTEPEWKYVPVRRY